MPAAAAAKQKGTGLVAYLNSQAPKIPVSQTLNLEHYYHSADLLLGQVISHAFYASRLRHRLRLSKVLECAQAAAYRAANNEEQLYVMLIRLAG